MLQFSTACHLQNKNIRKLYLRRSTRQLKAALRSQSATITNLKRGVGCTLLCIIKMQMLFYFRYKQTIKLDERNWFSLPSKDPDWPHAHHF